VIVHKKLRNRCSTELRRVGVAGAAILLLAALGYALGASGDDGLANVSPGAQNDARRALTDARSLVDNPVERHRARGVGTSDVPRIWVSLRVRCFMDFCASRLLSLPSRFEGS
jgi:hypothetical protein